MTDEWKEELNKIYKKHSWLFKDLCNENLVQDDYDEVFNDFNFLLTQATSKAREEVVNTILEKHFHYITRDNLWSFRGNQYHEPYLADEIAKDIQSLKKDK